MISFIRRAQVYLRGYGAWQTCICAHMLASTYLISRLREDRDQMKQKLGAQSWRIWKLEHPYTPIESRQPSGRANI